MMLLDDILDWRESVEEPGCTEESHSSDIVSNRGGRGDNNICTVLEHLLIYHHVLQNCLFLEIPKNVFMNWSSADCDVDQKFAKIGSKTCQASWAAGQIDEKLTRDRSEQMNGLEPQQMENPPSLPQNIIIGW